MTRAAALLAVCAALGLADPASAQPAAAALGDGPLALDAADGVEWRQEEHLFIAEGGAVARQANVTLRADRLVAAYRKGASGGIEIFRVDAEGAVRIENQGDVATGGRAVFDLAASTVALTGPGLSYTNGAATVTAQKALNYDVKGRRATATGAAQVTDRRGRLTAGTIEARFRGNGVSEARAWGGVTIQTPSETLRAKTARYDFARERAEAKGDVRIVKGPNVLSGERATVDFKTGISKLFGGGAATPGGGRVRGLVFPQATQ